MNKDKTTFEIDPETDFEEEDLIVSEVDVQAQDRRTENIIRVSSGAVFLDEVIEEYDR